MGTSITFPSNGTDGQGYLAEPESGSGPAIIVIQEWWGLVPHICDVADRFAAEGFVALAPDLYRGVTASEPDEAGKEMMALDLGRAARDLSGAVDMLLEKTGRDKIGVVGYCMGGGLALTLACQRPDAVAAAAPYYGVIPWPEAQPKWGEIKAKIVGEYAEDDDFANPEATRALEAQLVALGKDATMHIHGGTMHAFFNDARPDSYDETASAIAFARTIALFREALV